MTLSKFMLASRNLETKGQNAFNGQIGISIQG